MRNSTIMFLVAILILGWFGSEIFTAQEICVTSCMDLSGLNVWEQGIAAVILPVFLVLIGINSRRNENALRKTKAKSST